MNSGVKELMDNIVNNDYCVGCGICASLDKSPLKMELNENGKYRPVIEGDRVQNEDEMDMNIMSICPFSNEAKNETELGEKLFGNQGTSFNEYTGYYLKTYAGYVKEGNYREKGSSGGMGSWIAAQLLKLNLVDGIIHVKNTAGDKDPTLFEYGVSTDIEELLTGAKSKYYPIELSKVIQYVRENKGRYAIIGIPCFIKSVRLLAEQDKIVQSRIKFSIGLVCGHLKSDMFAKSIGWQLGIEPEQLKMIDFRRKLENNPAYNYGVEVEGMKDGDRVNITAATKDLYTTNWGYGFFKYNACEFCDDVMAETADVTVGDAWLPEYVSDYRGTNIIIVRNPVIQNIMEMNQENTIHLEEIGKEKIYQCQAGGFRHRREGLSYRLYLKDKEGKWRPKKRVHASNKISNKRKKIYSKRVTLSEESYEAFKLAIKEKGFNTFVNYMDPLLKDYNQTAKVSFAVRALRKVKRETNKLLKI